MAMIAFDSSVIRWGAFAILIAIFAIGAISNVVIVARYWLRKIRGSLIPVVGGLAGTLACIIAPNVSVRSLWWLPLLVDIGTLPLVVSALVWLLIRRLKQSR